ncbi:transposase zinc-binding domain-containing protein [Archangium violaceum]|uniref:transposase zinc-binding domain-containing protein n=1 Tax=Archangium violaceum TaxID=83451 RepID=UPI002B3173BC|nr:transposase zinc-binding domain-containing protein [Archangium gephyra]
MNRGPLRRGGEAPGAAPRARPTLAWLAQLGRGLPWYVERDFASYLECGVLAHGFARVRCESCKDELLAAFSCKGRGVCPSCNAKRAHVTAVHQVERVLPHVPYRQPGTPRLPPPHLLVAIRIRRLPSIEEHWRADLLTVGPG